LVEIEERLDRLLVLERVIAVVEITNLVGVGLFDVRQDHRRPDPDESAGICALRIRQRPLNIVIVEQRQANLLHVVGALRPPGRLAHRLHSGQQQCDKNGDDGDHD
jgi:hypothetical protein